MARAPKGFQAVELASPDGRFLVLATGPAEVERLKAEGYKSADEVDTGADAETANAGREGNQKAADSSTTKVAKDGVERPATSGA